MTSACATQPRPRSTAPSRVWVRTTSSRYRRSLARSGATLAREQVQADDKEHVLNAVGTAATAMRAKLGESRNSIQKLNRPLEQATTGSLEALQNYTAGRAELTQGRFLSGCSVVRARHRARSEFRHGLPPPCDRSTTMPGTSEREAEYNRKAFALIDRVSERERYAIAAGYYESTGELDKAIDAYRAGYRELSPRLGIS